jgi:hypothetical protein
MATLLDTELCTYAEHRDELLREAEGQFVLIRGRAVAGVYTTDMEAIDAGYHQFGNVPFLVKEIVAVEQPETFASRLIGL